MSDPHDLDHYLEALMEGRIDPDGAEARDLFARKPELREAFEANRLVLAQLDAGVAFEKANLEEASRLAETPDLDLVHRTIRDAARGSGSVLAAPRLWLAALAATLVALLALWVQRPEGPQGDMLLGGRLELVQPVGLVEGFGTFEWDAKLPRDGAFVVVVFEAAAPGGAELLRSGELREPRWQPEPDAVRQLPERIRWRVDVLDSARAPVARESATAERTQR